MRRQLSTPGCPRTRCLWPAQHPPLSPGREKWARGSAPIPWFLLQDSGGGGGSRVVRRIRGIKKHGLLASLRFRHVLWRSTKSMAANPMRRGQHCQSLYCLPRGLVESHQGLCLHESTVPICDSQIQRTLATEFVL